MPSIFRFLALACVFTTVLNGFYGFVMNMLYATNEPQETKPFKPHIEDPTLLVPVKTYESLYHMNKASSVENISTGNISNAKSDINPFIQNVTQNVTAEDLASSEDLDSIYSDTDLDELAKKFPEVHKGGWYRPPNVTTLQSVAIIVPYRDREKHLKLFLKIMHLFLMKQQIEYGIFIIEQAGTLPFNRGKLFNVGFVESQKMGSWQCFILHDVDLLPADLRILYQCGKQPRHLSAGVDTFSYQVPYNTIFGGVTALTLNQFKTVNGYSNNYWGWGGEDDDLFRRLWIMNYRITRYNTSIARYIMLDHTKQPPNLKRRLILSKTYKVFKEDGLSSLKYVVRNISWTQLFTYILADIDDKSALDSDPYVANKLFGDNKILT